MGPSTARSAGWMSLSGSWSDLLNEPVPGRPGGSDGPDCPGGVPGGGVPGSSTGSARSPRQLEAFRPRHRGSPSALPSGINLIAYFSVKIPRPFTLVPFPSLHHLGVLFWIARPGEELWRASSRALPPPPSASGSCRPRPPRLPTRLRGGPSLGSSLCIGMEPALCPVCPGKSSG